MAFSRLQLIIYQWHFRQMKNLPEALFANAKQNAKHDEGGDNADAHHGPCWQIRLLFCRGHIFSRKIEEHT